MKKKMKRAAALGMALCMTALTVLEGGRVVMAQESTGFDMSATSPTDDEDWESLKLDMGGPETVDTYGYWGTPLGNGVFAAKENGRVEEDVFVLNHSTFWSGDPEYRDSLYEGEGGYGHTPEERAQGYQHLIDTLKQAYSDEVTTKERNDLMKSVNQVTQEAWESREQAAFLSAGRMRMKFPELEDTTDYKRILDLDKAMSEITFKKDGTGYKRETFISNPDNVMVTRLTNEADEKMYMELSLELPAEMVGKSGDNQVFVDEENNEVVMTGRAPYDFLATQWDENRGTLLETRAKVVLPEGGEISADGSALKVSGATEILVLYTSETSFKDALTDPSNSGVDYSGKVRKTLDEAESMTYDELLERHLEEYRSLFRRLWIDLGGG